MFGRNSIRSFDKNIIAPSIAKTTYSRTRLDLALILLGIYYSEALAAVYRSIADTVSGRCCAIANIEAPISLSLFPNELHTNDGIEESGVVDKLERIECLAEVIGIGVYGKDNRLVLCLNRDGNGLCALADGCIGGVGCGVPYACISSRSAGNERCDDDKERCEK